MSWQCLNRQIPDKETITREVLAWGIMRNKEATDVDWQFNSTDARIKLKKLCSSLHQTDKINDLNGVCNSFRM